MEKGILFETREYEEKQPICNSLGEVITHIPVKKLALCKVEILEIYKNDKEAD